MRELAGLFAALENTAGGGISGISRSDNVKFENEDDALAYAKRLAALKPGDAVFTKAEGKEPQRGIFLGPADDGRRAHVLYFDEDRELAGKGTPWSCIRFPE